MPTLLRHLPRFRQARASLPELAARETWSRNRIEVFQLETINRLWRHAQTATAYYRKLREQVGLPSEFASLDEYTSLMPVLPKATVRDQPQTLLSEQPRPGNWQRTGGSTGTPTRVFREHARHRRVLAARYRCLQAWEVDFLAPHAMLWGHANSFAPGWKGRLARMKRPVEDWLRGRLRLSAYSLSSDDISRYLQQMTAQRSVWLYGYSSAVYLLAQQAEQAASRLPQLRLCMLTAEPVYPEMVDAIESAFDAPAIAEYGSVETGIIASEHPDRTLRVREDQVLLETVARDDGQYDLVVTVLENQSFPLMRFAIGDVSPQPLAKADSGFAILPRVAGRDNDMLQSRDGRLVHSLGVKHVFEQCRGVRRFRAHQTSDGQLQVTIEADPLEQDMSLQLAEQQLTDLLDGYPVEFQLVDNIEGNQAGKHRWIESDMVSPHRPPTSP